MGYMTGNGRDMTSVMHRWKVRLSTSKLSDRRLCSRILDGDEQLEAETI